MLKDYSMRKMIRILEVPLYLLIISMMCMELGSSLMAFFLLIFSILRLVVNVVTDEFNYKK